MKPLLDPLKDESENEPNWKQLRVVGLLYFLGGISGRYSWVNK
jgi:hypothetical protein